MGVCLLPRKEIHRIKGRPFSSTVAGGSAKDVLPFLLARGKEMAMELLKYIIPAAALIIVQLIISFKQDEVNVVRQNMAIDAIKEDIKRLEEKQDKHNQLIERMVKVEASDKAQWKQIDEMKEKI